MQLSRLPLDQGWIGQLCPLRSQFIGPQKPKPVSMSRIHGQCRPSSSLMAIDNGHRVRGQRASPHSSGSPDAAGSGAKPKRLKIIANRPLAKRQAWMELLLLGS